VEQYVIWHEVALVVLRVYQGLQKDRHGILDVINCSQEGTHCQKASVGDGDHASARRRVLTESMGPRTQQCVTTILSDEKAR